MYYVQDPRFNLIIHEVLERNPDAAKRLPPRLEIKADDNFHLNSHEFEMLKILSIEIIENPNASLINKLMKSPATLKNDPMLLIYYEEQSLQNFAKWLPEPTVPWIKKISGLDLSDFYY